MQDSGIAELIEFVKASSKRDSGISSTAPSYNSKAASAPIATQDSKVKESTEPEAEDTSPMNDSVAISSSACTSNSTNAPIAEHEPSSGERVASIAELLEQILIDLDLTSYEGVRTLLLSQRTSKAFRDTIANTPSLQRALHFSLSHKRWSIKSSRPQRSILFDNDRYIKIHDPFDSEMAIDFSYEYAIEGTGGAIGITVIVRRTGEEWYREEGTESNLSSHLLRQSWRRMYLFEDLGLIVGTVRNEGLHDYEVKGYWKNPTLGEMFDLLYSV